MRTLRRIARQLGQLEARREALLRRHLHVVGLRLQRRAPGGILRHQLFALLVAVDLALSSPCRIVLQFMNGNWKPSRSALASSSVFAEVLNDDVHAPHRFGLVVVDLDEDDVLLQAHGVVAAAVEALAD